MSQVIARHDHPADTGSAVGDDLFRILVQSVKDYAIFFLNPDGYVITWNEGAERIKGYAPEEIIGRHFSVFYPRRAIENGWPEHELRVAGEEGRFEDESWRIRKDGSVFWADVVITAVRDSAGRLLGFAKVTRDLTERKLMEDSLRHSEERFRLLVDGVQDHAIFMLDPAGIVTTWNKGAERLKGYKAEEIIGQHFSKFYPREVIESGWPDHELDMAIRDGRFEDEGWRLRKDGSRFWANVVITALYDRDGTLKGFSRVTRDMTERRRWEQEIQALNRELSRRVDDLAELNRGLARKTEENEAFVYSVSHDVRAPLVNLLGFSNEVLVACEQLQDALKEPSVPETVRKRAAGIMDGSMAESVRYIQNAVTHLSGMIDSLLRLSRAGRVLYQLQRIDMGALVRRVIGSVQGTIGDANAEVIIGDLPPVMADPAAMEQLFGNLIANALRYRDPKRKCRIEIGTMPPDEPGSAVYFVRDNGLGIPDSATLHLFRAFQRLHPEAGPGEGIGLATVHRIVERHQGKIRVESSLGAGTTFYVQLPAGNVST